MDYAAHYERLIGRARGRTLEGYRERHHVLPRCMGGGNEPENIVALTAEEHYVSHQLLVQLYPGVKTLAHAATMMAARCSGNKAYGWLRRRSSEAMIGNTRCAGQTLSIETRAKIAATLLGRKHTAERAANISRAKKGKKQSPTAVAKSAASRTGMKFTPERCANISASRKGIALTDEWRAKISAAHMGKKKPRSAEHQARIWESRRANNTMQKASP